MHPPSALQPVPTYVLNPIPLALRLANLANSTFKEEVICKHPHKSHWASFFYVSLSAHPPEIIMTIIILEPLLPHFIFFHDVFCYIKGVLPIFEFSSRLELHKNLKVRRTSRHPVRVCNLPLHLMVLVMCLLPPL